MPTPPWWEWPESLAQQVNVAAPLEGSVYQMYQMTTPTAAAALHVPAAHVHNRGAMITSVVIAINGISEISS